MVFQHHPRPPHRTFQKSRRRTLQQILPFATTVFWPPTTGVAKNFVAPPFDLLNSGGVGSTSLEKLLQANNNKWSVIFVYPGSPAGGCTLEARYLMRTIESFQQLNTQVVGMAVDDMDIASGQTPCSVEGTDLYPLSDRGGVVQAKYSAAVGSQKESMGTRQIYILDPAGTIVWNRQNVQSRVPTSSEEVLAILKELQSRRDEKEALANCRKPTNSNRLSTFTSYFAAGGGFSW